MRVAMFGNDYMGALDPSGFSLNTTPAAPAQQDKVVADSVSQYVNMGIEGLTKLYEIRTQAKTAKQLAEINRGISAMETGMPYTPAYSSGVPTWVYVAGAGALGLVAITMLQRKRRRRR